MWQAVAGAVVGGLLQNRAAKRQAASMNAQAAAQMEAARIAAEEARFRPVGITTRFSTATPQFTGGRLSGYDYQATPELAALQEQLSRIYSPSLGQAERIASIQPQFEQAAQGLFTLGQAEIPQSREQIMAQQRALLRPSDIEEEQRLAAGVFGRGRGGLSVGSGGQPELQALAEARRRRDLQLAANVDDIFMRRAGQAAGLFGTGAGLLGQGYQAQQAALAPFQSAFQTQQALEEEARRPIDIGSALGAKTSSAGATAGQMMMSGQQAAGALQQQAASAKAAQLAGIGQGIAGFGQQLYQQQRYDETLDKILNRPPATTPSIAQRTGGGSFMTNQLIPGLLGGPTNFS